MSRHLIVSATLAAALLGGSASAGAELPLPPIDDNAPIFGWQIMTPLERFEQIERLRRARTPEERERLRAEHHDRMMQRARDRGFARPPEPSERDGRIPSQRDVPGGRRRELSAPAVPAPRLAAR